MVNCQTTARKQRGPKSTPLAGIALYWIGTDTKEHTWSTRHRPLHCGVLLLFKNISNRNCSTHINNTKVWNHVRTIHLVSFSQGLIYVYEWSPYLIFVAIHYVIVHNGPSRYGVTQLRRLVELSFETLDALRHTWNVQFINTQTWCYWVGLAIESLVPRLS